MQLRTGYAWARDASLEAQDAREEEAGKEDALGKKKERDVTDRKEDATVFLAQKTHFRTKGCVPRDTETTVCLSRPNVAFNNLTSGLSLKLAAFLATTLRWQ